MFFFSPLSRGLGLTAAFLLLLLGHHTTLGQTENSNLRAATPSKLEEAKCDVDVFVVGLGYAGVAALYELYRYNEWAEARGKQTYSMKGADMVSGKKKGALHGSMLYCMFFDPSSTIVSRASKMLLSLHRIPGSVHRRPQHRRESAVRWAGKPGLPIDERIHSENRRYRTRLPALE